jgi:hypothetical protein
MCTMSLLPTILQASGSMTERGANRPSLYQEMMHRRMNTSHCTHVYADTVDKPVFGDRIQKQVIDDSRALWGEGPPPNPCPRPQVMTRDLSPSTRSPSARHSSMRSPSTLSQPTTQRQQPEFEDVIAARNGSQHVIAHDNKFNIADMKEASRDHTLSVRPDQKRLESTERGVKVLDILTNVSDNSALSTCSASPERALSELESLPHSDSNRTLSSTPSGPDGRADNVLFPLKRSNTAPASAPVMSASTSIMLTMLKGMPAFLGTHKYLEEAQGMQQVCVHARECFINRLWHR